MSDYIKREDALGCVLGVFDRQMIKELPATDVVPVVRGKWNGWHGDKLVGIDDNGDDMYRHYHYNTCSECGRGNAIKSAYCPHCGAKMGAEG